MMDCNAPLKLPERMSASSRPAKAAAAAMRDQGRICRQKRPLALCCTGRTKSSVSPSRADRLGGMSEWPGQPRRSGNFGDHTASPRRSPQRPRCRWRTRRWPCPPPWPPVAAGVTAALTHHPDGPASHWCAERAGWSWWVSSWWFSSGRWGPAHRCSPAGAVPAPSASDRPEPARSGACQPCGDHLQSRPCGPGDRPRPGRSARSRRRPPPGHNRTGTQCRWSGAGGLRPHPTTWRASALDELADLGGGQGRRAEPTRAHRSTRTALAAGLDLTGPLDDPGEELGLLLLEGHDLLLDGVG